jgi:hypothetical protein
MTKSFDPSVPFPDSNTARTHSRLHCVKALFKIDDPALEQALVVMLERLAANQVANAAASRDGLEPKPPQE